MAGLTLQFLDGSSETRELSRSQPLNIGRQQFNDICVPDPEVGPLHCRVSWNKSRFEVTAATSQGVEVNSVTVGHADLKQGDVIRVGSLDLIFHDEATILKSVEDPPPSPPTLSPEHRPVRKSRKVEPAEKPVDEMSLYDGVVQTESQAMLDMLNDDDDEGDVEDDWTLKDVKKPKRDDDAPAAPSRKFRPGEEDVLKSPLVLGLTGGGLTLLLVTGIFWLFISREQSNRLYERAVKEMTDGQYAQALTTYEKFITENPNHVMRKQADRGLAKTLVLKEISGASPAWNRGLERLNELIKTHRNDSDFSDLHSSIFQYAEQISLGAAKTAEVARDAQYLTISREAQVLLERYADPSTPPTGTIGRINEQRVKADRAIDKQKTFDLAMNAVDSAIADRKPMAALSERERLVRAFPDLVGTKRVKQALQNSLDLERSVVATDEIDVPAETVDDPVPVNEPVLGLLQARSRTDEASQGQVVFVIAKDCCYAIDSVTGDLVWRRVIGAGSPFFPVVTTGAQQSILLFDTRKQALLSCNTTNGKLIWRQPLKAMAIGKPLVHQGQVYLGLDGNSMARIELDTGRLTAKVRFSQNLASSPVLSYDQDYLLVPGQMAMIYSLSVRATSKRPALTAVATTFTDHSAGSISAPPLLMGHLLLLCENDLADSARLRLWNADKPMESLIELNSVRITGQVRDVPVLRGNQVVVPSEGEQFAAFVVSDEAGRAGITRTGEYHADQTLLKDRISVPVFLALGPDGQFWAAGTAFRRFEIVSNTIRMDSNSTAPGIASQPLQSFGDYFFVGRKSRFSDAVTFSSVDREKLVNPWRCVLGDAPLEILPTRDGGIVWVSESGALYTFGKNRLAKGGVDLRAGADLDLPPNVTKPIRVSLLHDQRMVAFAAGETIQMFLLNSNGQVTGKTELKEFPEADPVLLDEGIVVPSATRLKIVSLSASKRPIQDWIAPIGETTDHRWAHMIRLNGREFVACDGNGRMTRIQYRPGDISHLAEVSNVQLDQPIDVRPILRGDSLYVADARGNCRQLSVSSFDTVGQRKLTEPIRNVWSAADKLIVQAGDGKLHCLSDGKELPESWVYDLNGLNPIGPVITQSDALWFGCRDGTIVVLSLASGAEVRRLSVPQSLSLGLRQVGDTLFAVAADGMLYRIE